MPLYSDEGFWGVLTDFYMTGDFLAASFWLLLSFLLKVGWIGWILGATNDLLRSVKSIKSDLVFPSCDHYI
jgi:hypothetical protein